jgi:hypothetical protein
MPQWIEEEYHENDKPLIYDSAVIDCAYTHSFVVAQNKIISASTLPKEGDLESLLEQTLYLQEHIHLFELNYDLFAFRTEFLKQEPDYWIDNDFPPLKKEKRYYFILYRNQNNDINVKGISAEEHQLLNKFKEGSTVDAACEWLEKQDRAVYEKAMGNLHCWFQEWIVLKWLTYDAMPEKQPF